MKKYLLTAAAVARLFAVNAQPPEPPAVFTAAQAEKGRTEYLSTCGKCHTDSLLGRKGDPGEVPPVDSLPANMLETVRNYGGKIPPLAGPAFMAKWGARSTKDLSKRIDEAVGGFPPEGRDEKTFLNLTAYVLRMNGAKSGDDPLTADTAVAVRSTTAAAPAARPH